VKSAMRASLIVGRSARSHVPLSFEHPLATESVYSISDLIGSTATRERVRSKGIHSLCPNGQRVMIDSGGYQYLRQGKFPLRWEELIDFYNECGADDGVSLDRPAGAVSDAKTKIILAENLERYILMRGRAQANITIIPVLHGLSRPMVEWECRRLAAIDSAPPLVGLGGVVPHLMAITRNFRFGRDMAAKLKLVDLLHERFSVARETFPKSRLHVFGAGGTVSIAMALRAGANSVDSSGWRVRAAFGCILGPWGRQLRIRSQTQSPRMFQRSLRNTMDGCRCPVCTGSVETHRASKLIKSFDSRATHNLWMQFSDFTRVRAKLSGRRAGAHMSAPILSSHPLLHILGRAVQATSS
jgi:7-cyano-7-deazaguanine tRNA-ribosyltransferase